MGTVVLVLGGLRGLSEMYFFSFGFVLILGLLGLSFSWRVQSTLVLELSQSTADHGIQPSTGKNSNLARPAIRRAAVAWLKIGRRCAAVAGPGGVLGGSGVRCGVRACVSGAICIEPDDQHPRNLDLSKSYPRHPRLNFTESRVSRRALARRRTSRNELCRASRPKHTEAVGKLVSVTNKRLTIQAQTYARAQAVTGTCAVLHDVQILATVSFATQARYSCGFWLDLQAHVRWTLRLVERPPPLSSKI